MKLRFVGKGKSFEDIVESVVETFIQFQFQKKKKKKAISSSINPEMSFFGLKG